MEFITTRHSKEKVSLVEAIQQGLASDGGLFIPEEFPEVKLDLFSESMTYETFAYHVLKGFFVNTALEESLEAMCHTAFNFPCPLRQVNQNTYLLELFHGPTLSFKDFGCRFLAECLENLSHEKKTTVLVATSGDTGSAVAASLFQKPHCQVVVLFPRGKITPSQEKQIACFGENVLAVSVEGTFDDCQRLVKSSFSDTSWSAYHLTTSNSINIGRLLPQITYFAYTSVCFERKHQFAPGIIIPSGNLGNITAAYWAKKMGFPIREIVMATNANPVMQNYQTSGKFHPQPSIQTLASAMDVGNPSNFERLQSLFPDMDDFRQNVRVSSVDDEQIKKTIQDYFHEYKIMICPHTATGAYVRKQLSEDPWIVAATADPGKFDSVIEPLLQTPVAIPASLSEMLLKDNKSVSIKPELGELYEVVAGCFGGKN
jgi:threonine synthase